MINILAICMLIILVVFYVIDLYMIISSLRCVKLASIWFHLFTTKINMYVSINHRKQLGCLLARDPELFLF